jgi:hypothetical protein
MPEVRLEDGWGAAADGTRTCRTPVTSELHHALDTVGVGGCIVLYCTICKLCEFDMQFYGVLVLLWLRKLQNTASSSTLSRSEFQAFFLMVTCLNKINNR